MTRTKPTKAIVAAIGGAVATVYTAVVSAFSDDQITGQEWLVIGGVALTATLTAVTVYGAENKPTAPNLARYGRDGS